MARITKKQQALNREKWLTALESGKYKQTTGILHRKDKKSEAFCCLGVACVVAQENGVKLKVIEPTADKTAVFYDDDEGLLPLRVRKWLGLKTNDGQLSMTESLVGYNDNGMKFKTIAKKIRENIGKLVE
jgi:hypothetical protein